MDPYDTPWLTECVRSAQPPGAAGRPREAASWSTSELAEAIDAVRGDLSLV